MTRTAIMGRVPFVQCYSTAELLAELRRVADQYPRQPLTVALIAAASPVSLATFRRRFGDWQAVLSAAGLQDRYVGRSVTPKMRALRSRRMSDEQIVGELRRLAHPDGQITMPALRGSPVISERVVTARFGSWPAAVAAAGLRQSRMANRWTEDQLSTNLETLLELYGRPPTSTEMRRPPSTINRTTYTNRFGSWPEVLEWFRTRQGSKHGNSSTPS